MDNRLDRRRVHVRYPRRFGRLQPRRMSLSVGALPDRQRDFNNGPTPYPRPWHRAKRLVALGLRDGVDCFRHFALMHYDDDD